jgi:hypothetical protein
MDLKPLWITNELKLQDSYLIQGFHFQITLLMKLPEKENVLF